MENLLEVRVLKTHCATDRGLFRAVDGISFSVPKGRTIGLVGESGCGKSVTSLSVMGLVASPAGNGRGVGGAVGQSRRAAAVSRRAPQAARQQDVDDLPGAYDLAQSGPHR